MVGSFGLDYPIGTWRAPAVGSVLGNASVVAEAGTVGC